MYLAGVGRDSKVHKVPCNHSPEVCADGAGSDPSFDSYQHSRSSEGGLDISVASQTGDGPLVVPQGPLTSPHCEKCPLEVYASYLVGNV